MSERVILGLGGNLGDVKQRFDQILSLIQPLALGPILCSRFYVTSPLSPMPQPDFLNATCLFDTSLTPLELLDQLQKIEIALGKRAKPKWAPRPIDIDILFFGSKSIVSERLEIPHPRWRERLFVVAPLSDLMERVDLPSGESVALAHLASELASEQKAIPLKASELESQEEF